jgi:hypothetical protein
MPKTFALCPKSGETTGSKVPGELDAQIDMNGPAQAA